MQHFWIHRQQADVEMKDGGKPEEIRKHLNFAVAALGRPAPVGSRMELLASALWQVTHQILHRLGLDRWFVTRAGGFAIDKNTRCISITRFLKLFELMAHNSAKYSLD